MNLIDKRFWTYEAIVLICTGICIFILWINHLLWFNFVAFGFCCLFLLGGAMAWKLYKCNQWWKLAGYLFLITTVLLAIVLFSFVWDWNDNGERPANISPDEGHYITNNELVGIIMLLWLICAPILSCAISYIAKRVLCKNDRGEQ
ncbi:hypothetical protein DXA95_11175 [Odoribacter sp. OF09-27XD]|nr:hypothetical protein DXA95_11175 [Odoribacter sp. OF09-27XD]